jgi:hypothetical protein
MDRWPASEDSFSSQPVEGKTPRQVGFNVAVSAMNWQVYGSGGMRGSTITVSVGQFAQHLRQKYPQYGSAPDDKLSAAFLSKNPKYK